MGEVKTFFFSGQNGQVGEHLKQLAEKKGISPAGKEEEASLYFLETSDVEGALKFFSEKENIKGIKSVICSPESYPSFVEAKKEKKYQGVFKQLLEEEVLQFFFSLCLLPKYSEKADMEVLFEEYKWSLLDKYYILRDLREGFLQNKKKEDLEALKKAVHKLAGNSGSYGFLKVSELCKKEEQDLEKGLQEIDKRDWGKELPSFFSSLLAAFSEFSPQKQAEPEKEVLEKKEGTSLYLIDDDVDFTNLIKQVALSKNIAIEVENSFLAAEKKLADAGFQPRIILFDLVSEKESLSGLDLVQKYTESHPQKGDTVLGILSAQGEASFRSEAVNKSIDLYLQKPISPEGLLSQIELILSNKLEGGGSLFLIDDDSDFCQFFTKVFENTPWKVKTASSCKQIFQDLESFSPDLLFLDIEMPEIDGIQALKMVRSDARYNSLNVFIVTAKKDPEHLRFLAQLGIQGFLLKPIEPKELQSQVRAFFQKQEALSIIYKKDPFLGVYQKRALESFLKTLIVQEKEFGIVLFQVEEFSPEKKEKEKWNYFTTSLNQFFPQKDLAGVWAEKEIVLVFSTFPRKLLYRLVHSFLQFLTEDEKLKSLFEVFKIYTSIIFYPEEGKNIVELIEKGKRLIQEKKGEKKWGVFGEEGLFGTKRTGKKALMVSSDEEIRTVLRFYLQREHFILIEIPTGKEGLSWIHKKMFEEKVDFIILDMDLQDISGILFLEKLATFSGEKIPLMVLSYHNRDKEILEIFSLKNIIYIQKPFSLEAFSRRLEQLL